MTLDEGKLLWTLHDDTAPRRPPADVLQTVRARADDFDRLIRRRDRREEGAALAVAVFFGLAGVGTLAVGLYLSSLGATLIVLASAWIFWRLRSTRLRHTYARDAGTLPPAHLLLFEIEKIEAQIGLLRTVFWWYVLPLMTGLLVFMLGLPEGMERAPVYVLVAAVISASIHRLNQQAVRTELLPRRDEWRALLLDWTEEAGPTEAP